MKQIRNLTHYIVGFVFLYCIGNATYVSDFLEWQKIVGSILIGLIFGGTIGAFWELFNNIAFGIKHDENDIKRTAIGGGAGINNLSPAAINGASILSSSISPLIPGGEGSIVLGSNGSNGANGITSWKPFFSLGGAGGGNSLNGIGGNGGRGGIGSGGGSGGCVSSGTGGNGGKGGDGLVIIISF